LKGAEERQGDAKEKRIVMTDPILLPEVVSEEGEIISTKKGLARAMLVDASRVRGWIKKGMPVREDGQFDLAVVRNWYNGRLKEHTEKNLKSNFHYLTKLSVKDFETDRANILLKEQVDAISLQRTIKDEALTRTRIKGMADQHLIAWYDKLGMDASRKFEQERLVKGESTENVAVIVRAIKELKEKQAD
jgi:phage terminase Nu1 subunit (DNA packaging protein)